MGHLEKTSSKNAASSSGRAKNPAPFPLAVTVPEGQLFVMGDNRECSEDSRSPRVGTIEQSTIVGKVIVRLYPFNTIKTFKGVDYES